MPVDLYTCAADKLDGGVVCEFVRNAIETRVQAESLLLEFKRQNDRENVVKALAAMANTDGGVVVVGVDEASTDPFVGLRSKDVDALVQHIRSVLPDLMPEVLPVALPGRSDRLLLVLRVGADAADHPVVLNGRVMKRVPGQSGGARRDEIVALCHRAPESPLGTAMPGLHDVARLRMWEAAADPLCEARVHALFSLPRHAVRRAYLGTPALRGAVEALEASPVPAGLRSDQMSHHERQECSWERSESASIRARFRANRSETNPRWRPAFEAAAYVALAGRLLDVVVAVSIEPRHDDSTSVGLGDLRNTHELLLGAAVTAIALGRRCAAEMEAGAPLHPPRLGGSLAGEHSLSTLELPRRWVLEPRRTLSNAWILPSDYPADWSIDAVDAMVKEWLITPVFELGAIGFEDELPAMPLPHWAFSANQGA